ncbi:MAG: cytochrome c oxidase subunit II [Bacteroidetes bacterium]|nr:cytochrome c oxidase subunit II [Bacteroidota bacterium]
MWKNWTCKACTLAVFFLFLATAHVAFGQKTLGAEAAARAAEAGPVVDPAAKGEWVSILIKAVQGLGLLLLLLVVFLTSRLARLVDFDPFKNWNANVMNARMFAVFGAIFAGFILYELKYHAPYILPSSASVHGAEIDNLYNITLIMTGLVFVITQALLFFYAFRYQNSPRRKALYYPDNHKLELIWTLVPALALAVVVLYGVKVWNDIHHPQLAQEPIRIEVVAEQFKWTLRYSGDDATLGKYDYKKITGDNPLGLDSLDKAAHDDKVVYTKELHLPVNRPVTLHARAKDVLHGMYIPHFAVNVYAVPGMPTQFTFTPTMTTDQMRRKTGNPKFNYEMACGQLCGSSHYNMRVVVIIEDEASYKKWVAEQPTWITKDAPATAPEAPKSDAPKGQTAMNQIPVRTASLQ